MKTRAAACPLDRHASNRSIRWRSATLHQRNPREGRRCADAGGVNSRQMLLRPTQPHLGHGRSRRQVRAFDPSRRFGSEWTAIEHLGTGSGDCPREVVAAGPSVPAEVRRADLQPVVVVAQCGVGERWIRKCGTSPEPKVRLGLSRCHAPRKAHQPTRPGNLRAPNTSRLTTGQLGGGAAKRRRRCRPGKG